MKKNLKLKNTLDFQKAIFQQIFIFQHLFTYEIFMENKKQSFHSVMDHLDGRAGPGHMAWENSSVKVLTDGLTNCARNHYRRLKQQVLCLLVPSDFKFRLCFPEDNCSKIIHTNQLYFLK